MHARRVEAGDYNTIVSPRFFIPPAFAALAAGARITLPDAAAHHAARVLRLAAGDAVTLFDGQGGEYSAVITSTGRKVEVKLAAFDPVEREGPFPVELVQAVSSGDRMDFTVQKAVELGAAAIRPVISERSVVKLAGERADRRVAHWQQIAVSACEQCGRNRVPVVYPIQPLDRFLAEPGAALRLLLSPRAGTLLRSLAKPAVTVQLLIGPEGGFSEGEERAAMAMGYAAVNLGLRVLRTETAALGALAAMSALWEG